MWVWAGLKPALFNPPPQRIQRASIDKTSMINLLNQLARMTAQPIPDGARDVLAAARIWNDGYTLRVYPTEALTLAIDGVQFVPDAEDADTVLVIHRDDVARTAVEIETRTGLGQRVALVDLKFASEAHDHAEKADPALIPALTHTTVYLSNLAAWDVDIRRALAVVMTPTRDGAAHRQLLALNMAYYWAWRGIVIDEVRRLFGDIIPNHGMLRAETQTRSRIGAHLIKLRGRGLRYFVENVRFEGGRVDDVRFDLTAE